MRKFHFVLELHTGYNGDHTRIQQQAGNIRYWTLCPNPDTAWFVPATRDEQRFPVDARVVVTRTRDGGRHFDVLQQGLPGKHAYDLVYRHALDVASDGQRLAFGSTTGSLWISEDQGDSWQTVSTHLPPVLCVRFEA